MCEIETCLVDFILEHLFDEAIGDIDIAAIHICGEVCGYVQLRHQVRSHKGVHSKCRCFHINQLKNRNSYI